jgi:hypothetical protein
MVFCRGLTDKENPGFDITFLLFDGGIYLAEKRRALNKSLDFAPFDRLRAGWTGLGAF